MERGSLPYRTMPLWRDLSRSTSGKYRFLMSSRPDNAGANVRFTGAGAGAATFAASPLATASPNSGRLARVLNRCLLANIADSFPLLTRSGVRLRVARGGHVETDHHGMIFVNHVVAVHRVAALPISKAHFDRGVAPR